MWTIIEENLRYIVPVFFPLVFIAANWSLKNTIGALNREFLGPDLAIAACTLFGGTMIGFMFRETLTEPDAVVTAIIALVIFVGLWVTSVALVSGWIEGKRKKKICQWLSFLIGSVSLYNSCQMVVFSLQQSR